MQKRMMWIGC